MSTFRDLVDGMDKTIFSCLSDDVVVDGRSVCGMFYSPWLGPEMGRLKTGVIEPRATIRDADVLDAKRGSLVVFEGNEYEVIALEPEGTGVTVLVLRPNS